MPNAGQQLIPTTCQKSSVAHILTVSSLKNPLSGCMLAHLPSVDRPNTRRQFLPTYGGLHHIKTIKGKQPSVMVTLACFLHD